MRRLHAVILESKPIAAYAHSCNKACAQNKNFFQPNQAHGEPSQAFHSVHPKTPRSERHKKQYIQPAFPDNTCLRTWPVTRSAEQYSNCNCCGEEKKLRQYQPVVGMPHFFTQRLLARARHSKTQ